MDLDGLFLHAAFKVLETEGKITEPVIKIDRLVP